MRRTRIINGFLSPIVFTETRHSSEMVGATYVTETIVQSVSVAPNVVVVDNETFYTPNVATPQQTLMPALYVDTDVAYAPNVAAGSVTVQPSTIIDTDIAHAPNVGNYLQISPSLYVDTDTFAAPIISSNVTLSPNTVDADDTVNAPAIGQYWQLTAPLVVDIDVFFTPVVLGTYALQPSVVSSDDSLPSPSALTVNYLQPDAVQDIDTVAATDVKRGPLTLEPDTVLFGTEFFSPTVFIQLHVAPSLFFDGDRFPFPTSTALYEATTGEFNSDDVVFLPVLTTGPITIFPPLFADTDVEYVPAVQRQSKGGGNGGGGSGGTVTTNLKYASQLTMDATSGLITALEMQSGSSQVVNTRMMIYADNAGLPGALLGQTTTKSSVVAGANDYDLITPVSLLAGQAFWVALHSDGNFNWFLTNQKGGSRYNTDLFSDGPSDPFGAASVDNKKAPVFVVYLDAVNAAMLPPRVADVDITYSPHVTGAKALLPPLLADQDFTYGTVAHYSITLSDANKQSDDQTYAPSIAVGAVTMLPDLLVDDDTFRGANVGRGAGYVFPAPYADNDTFRAPLAEQNGAALAANLFSDVDTVYAPRAYDVVTVADNAFNADDVVFGPVVTRGDVAIAPPLVLDTAEDIFDPLVVRHGGTFAVLPPTYEDADVFYSGRVGYPPLAHRETLRGDCSQPSLSGGRNGVSLLGERDGKINLEGDR